MAPKKQKSKVQFEEGPKKSDEEINKVSEVTTGKESKPTTNEKAIN